MEDKKVKQGTETEEIEGMEISEIEKLTDDCLIEIFQHLSTIADRIRIERVSKRWQTLSRRSWNNFKSLDLSAKTWGIKENVFDQSLIRNIDFDKIIMLSGRYLTRISTDVGKFGKICHLLHKIQDLQLIDDCLDQKTKCTEKFHDSVDNRNTLITTGQCTNEAWKVILSWLMSHGENITSFKLKVTHSHYKEEDFARFLREMKQLQTFYLDNCEYLNCSGSFLLELPFETIQEIIFTSRCIYMLPFDNNLLSSMIKKCKKLETFGIDMCEEPVDGILEVLSSQAHTLKNLKLQFEKIENHSVLLSTLSALKNLEKLDISFCFYATDAFLEVVAQNCQKLTYLDLECCLELTDRGISRICDLEKLTYLNIGGLPEIGNPPLEKLTSLIVLDLCDNVSIQEECLFSFLKKAHQLRALNVRYCPSITNKLFNVAIEVAKMRDSKIELDIYASETGININALSEKASLLNFVSSDFIPDSTFTKYGIKHPFP